MNIQDKLKQKLDNLTVEAKNKKKLFDYFGEENLKRLPFDEVTKVYNANTYSSCGASYRRIYLLTGIVKEWCDVADYTIDRNITKSDLEWIEKEIFKKLDKK
ncbi:hypothetical protein RIU21_07275 [Riemerella anatipestifer]|uniref:hypothetical protein n=1 Tax=Riemerella anatipestifer TaxID=34085 RepID=UPI00285FC9F3|nr:hypothetical protein [Riemerella anatipestifer]MDR7846566.1 hypothetical protein [Riemerella anatipestifer]